MDSKIVVYGICMALVIAALAFWFHTMSLDELNHELLQARADANAIVGDADQIKSQITMRREVASLLSELSQQEAVNRRLRDEIETLRDASRNIGFSFRSAIAKARERLVGREILELVLKNGMRLRRVKVQSINDFEVVLSHDGGIMKTTVEDLPESITEMLLYQLHPGATVSGSTGSPSSSAGAASLGSFGASRPSATSTSDRLVNAGISSGVGRASNEDSPRPASKSLPAAGSVLPHGATRESLGRLYIPNRGWVDRRILDAESKR